ncbi:Tim44/TimA family putative adaptor protein [Paracoccaceae bacterium GXU_MW_L88]
MGGSMINLLILAAVAIFLGLRLKSVLGTRDGFEKPMDLPPSSKEPVEDAEIAPPVDPYADIEDHAEEGSDTALALRAMKEAEPGFDVNNFLRGARQAYEMLLMAYERGEREDLQPYLDPEVYEGFEAAISAREAEGLDVEAQFVGIREGSLQEASFDPETQEAEMTVRFVGELSVVVRNQAGEIVDGAKDEVKRQTDVWTFARKMGADDPNWLLVATG